MNNLSRYRSPSNPPERYFNRIQTADSIGLPAVPKQESRQGQLPKIYSPATRSKSLPKKYRIWKTKFLILTGSTNSIQDNITIIVIVKSIVNFKNTVTYINAITSDIRRVVIKSYGANKQVMSIKKGCVYKFVNLRVKDVANELHSDVDVDFVYNNYSAAYYVNSESINYQNSQAYDISDFRNLEDYIDQTIKITGIVSKSPRSVGNFYLLEVSDPDGTSLRVKIYPATFFIEAIKQGTNYHFIAELIQNGNYYELQVKIPDMTSIAISHLTRGYSRYGRGLKIY